MAKEREKLPDGLLDAGLIEHLQTTDLVGAVIRGHLYIEARLIQIIEYALPKPEYLDLNNMPFLRKLELAASTNWVNKETYEAIKQLNELRNRMSHRWHFQITEEDGNKLMMAVQQIKDLKGQPVAESYGSWFGLEITSEFDNLRKSIWWLYSKLTSDACVVRDWAKH